MLRCNLVFILAWQMGGASAKVEAGEIRFWTSQNDKYKI